MAVLFRIVEMEISAASRLDFLAGFSIDGF